MRAGDHDPPDDRDDAPDDPQPATDAPRFARLVRGRAARRLSPRRLVVGLLALLAVGWGGAEAARRAARGVAAFIAAQPEHRVRFDAIELVPPPPAYIARGATGILAAVRREGRYEETIPLLATDLDALRLDFRRNPWLKDVRAVRASYGHLAVEVVYRKPRALIEVKKSLEGTVIDPDAVVLPTGIGEFDRTEEQPGRYRPKGESRPLITIRGLGLGEPDREGRIWKSADPTIGEGRVVEAAHLAEEVAAHAGSTTPKGRPMPDFAEVLFLGEDNAEAPFALCEAGGRNKVWWGSAPGREAADEPPAARKWAFLAEQIDRGATPRLDLATGTWLRFRFDRSEVITPAPAPKPGRPRAKK